MDANGSVKDFVFRLLELYRQHSGVNIASVVAITLTNFRVDKDLVAYLTLNNAYNNDTAVASLANLQTCQRYGWPYGLKASLINIGIQPAGRRPRKIGIQPAGGVAKAVFGRVGRILLHIEIGGR
jgi:hypothetical protein